MDMQSITDKDHEVPVDVLAAGPDTSPTPKPEAKSDLEHAGGSDASNTVVMIRMVDDSSDALVEPSEGQAVVLSFHDLSDEIVTQSITDEAREVPVDVLAMAGLDTSPTPKPEAKSDLKHAGGSDASKTTMIRMVDASSDALVEPSEGQAVVLSLHDLSDEVKPPPLTPSPTEPEDLKVTLSSWDHVIFEQQDWLPPSRGRRSCVLSPLLEEGFDWAQDHRQRPLLFHAEEVANMSRDDLELQLMDLQGFTLGREGVMDDMQSELREKDADRSKMVDQIEALETQVTQARRKQLQLIDQAMKAQKEFGDAKAAVSNTRSNSHGRPLSAHGRFYPATGHDGQVGFVSGYRSPREECRKIFVEQRTGQKILRTYNDCGVQTKSNMEDFLANPEYEATIRRLRICDRENMILQEQLASERKQHLDLTEKKKLVTSMFERDIFERDLRYAEKQRKIKDKDRKIALIEEELQERENIYVQLEEKYNDREQKFRSMHSELGEKDLAHKRLLQKVEEQEEIISGLRRTYQNSEQNINDLKQQLTTSEKRFKGLREKSSSELKLLKAQLQNVPSACNHCTRKKSSQTAEKKAKSEVLLPKRKASREKKTPIMELIETYDLKHRSSAIDGASGAYRASLGVEKNATRECISLDELRHHQSNAANVKPKSGKSEMLASGRGTADKKLPLLRNKKVLPKIPVSRPPLPPQPPSAPRHPDNRRRIVKVKASAAF